MKRLIKIAIPVIVVIVIVILIRTHFLLNQIRHGLANSLNLKIEQIEGNLFSTIILKEVHYKDVFYSPLISISYTPVSIIRKNIKYIRIDSAFIKRGKIGGTFSLPVTVDNFSLRYAEVSNLSPIDTLQILDLKGSFSHQKLKIEKGAINIKVGAYRDYEVPPTPLLIKIEKIEGEALLSDTGILLNTASVKTHSSEFLISGSIKQDSINVRLDITKLQLQEFDKNASGDVTSEIYFIKTNQTLLSKGKISLKNGKYVRAYRDYEVPPTPLYIGDFETYFTFSNDSLQLKIKKWKLSAQPASGGSGGKDASLTGNISFVFPSSQFSPANGGAQFSAILFGEKIDLSMFFPSLNSNLNGKIEIQGKGENFSSTFDLTGSIRNINLQSIKTKISKTGSGIEILSFEGIHQNGRVEAKGTITPENLKLSFSGKRIDLSVFYPLISGSSEFDFLIQGAPKNPAILGSFCIKGIKFGGIEGEYCSGNLNIKDLRSLTGEAQLNIVNLDIYKNKVNTLQANFWAQEGIAGYKISAKDKSANIFLTGKGKTGARGATSSPDTDSPDSNVFSIDTFLLHFPNLEISSFEPVEIELKQKEINLKQWKLFVNKTIVQLKGILSRDNLDFTILSSDLNLNTLSEDFKGILDFNSTIKGTIQNPIILLSCEVTNFSHKTIIAERIFLGGIYKNQELFIEKGEFVNKNETIQFSGTIPFIPPLVFPDKLVDLSLIISNLGGKNFYPLNPFISLDKTVINADLKVKGTSKAPLIYGDLTLSGEDMGLKFLGVDLPKYVAKLEFQGDKINITSFHAKTENGFIKLNGYISLLEKMIDLQLITENMPVKAIQDVDAILSTTLSIKGSFKTPKVQGKIKIEEAVITAPFTQTKTVNVQYPLDYDLTINFPEKVWIKNSQVDAELSGEVEVRKLGQNFFLSGNASIKEGVFNAYYVPFKIEKGEVQFKNSPKLDADVNLLASNTVIYTTETADTTDKSSAIDTCIVYINVGGSIRKLEVSLFSNPQMPLLDIMTLLSLNIKIENIAEFQQFGYQQTGNKIVSWGLNELGVMQNLRNMMDVDVLRLDPDILSSHRKMKFNVGKHIFEDLYINYTNDLFAPSSHQFKAQYSPWKYGSIVGERDEEGKFKAGVLLKIRY